MARRAPRALVAGVRLALTLMLVPGCASEQPADRVRLREYEKAVQFARENMAKGDHVWAADQWRRAWLTSRSLGPSREREEPARSGAAATLDKLVDELADEARPIGPERATAMRDAADGLVETCGLKGPSVDRLRALAARLERGPPAEAPSPAVASAPTRPSSGGPSGSAASSPGSTYVLVVGVNEYQDEKIPALRFAEPDARAVFGFFATGRRSPTEADRVLILTGREATRSGILRAFREHLAMKATRPEDMIVFYFAGHGFADARQTYLAGSDARLTSLPETAISQATLDEYLAQVPARRRLILVDACRSGGLEGIRGIGGVAIAPTAGEAGDRESVLVLATGANEVSVEDPRLGNGIFTICLLNGLRGDAEADGDGRVSSDELERYLLREVPAVAARARGKQTPVFRRTPGSGAMLLTR